MYTLEALNLQYSYALLQSGIIENLRLFGNISDIELDKNGNRVYTADHGDAFTELLYMLYPSPAGDLSTHTHFKGRDSFAAYGSMSPELMAKFCAILNDYRNGKIKIPEKFKNFAKDDTIGANQLKIIDEGFEKAVKWMEERGISFKIYEKVKPSNKKTKPSDELIETKLSNKLNEIKNKNESMINIKMSEKDILEIKKEIQKKALTETHKQQLEKLGIDLKKAQTKLAMWEKDIKDYKNLMSLITNTKNNQECQKARAYFSFVNFLKGAVDLERAEGSAYPEYLTERILMSYMIKTLNTEEDVENLYQNIAKELAQNETNKIPTDISKKEEIAEKIKAKKQKIEKLSEIIASAKLKEFSPYKATAPGMGFAYKIGIPDENGEINFSTETFSDCVDVTVRNIVNLLTYSNDKNWDLLLNNTNTEYLRNKLKTVVDAINSSNPNKRKAPFYDLKTRLQMFFLYQKEKGADDGTILARTLWEYAICNMDKREHFTKEDSKKDFYNVHYVINKNYELSTNFVAVLKVMWNMASALDLGSESTGINSKLNLAKEKINKYCNHKNNLLEALNSTFSLFHSGNMDIKPTREGVTVNLDKGSLNFEICIRTGHGEVTHSPIDFKFDEKFEDEKYNFDEAKLLLRSFTKNSGNKNVTSPLKGFYGAYSKEKINNSDEFAKTDLYKRHKTLNIYKTLWDTTTDATKINKNVTSDVMEDAKRIKVKGKSKDINKDLSDIFYERLLKPNEDYISKPIIMYDYEKSKFGEIENAHYIGDENGSKNITNFEIIKQNGNSVRLIIKSIPDNGELIIPSKVYDENNNEFKVESIEKRDSKDLKDLKAVNFVGDFDNLKIMKAAFCKLEKLEKVKFEGKVGNLTIGDAAFENCRALETFQMSKCVKNLEIGEQAFKDSGTLVSFEIPEGIIDLRIRKAAFSCGGYEEEGEDSVALRNFTIPKNIKNLIIENRAFCYRDIEKFEIPEGVENVTLGDYSFYGCDNLSTFTIREGVINLKIEEYALQCKNLKTLIIPQSVKNLFVNEIAFQDSGLGKIHVPEGLKDQIPEKIKVVYYKYPTKSWWGNWLYLNFSAPIEQLTLDKVLLEYYAKKAGFKDISEIQAIQARDVNGKVKEISLDDDLKEDFSESKKVLGRIWGDWGNANLRKN